MTEREPLSPCIAILVRNPGLGNLSSILTNRLVDIGIDDFEVYSAELPEHEDICAIAIDEFDPKDEQVIRASIEEILDIIDHDFSAYDSPYISQSCMTVRSIGNTALLTTNRISSLIDRDTTAEDTSYKWN